MDISLPGGYRAAGVCCGLKASGKKDFSMIVSDLPATAAGVYTQNLVCAAPVQYDRTVTPADDVRIVITNSGNANACTGKRGLEDAQSMAAAALKAVPPAEGYPNGKALVLSTGVIGHFLPMDKINAGIEMAAAQLGRSEESVMNAATAIITTDTHEKIAIRTVTINGVTVKIWGMAKGAAMIGPNMATMLVVVLTDAILPPMVAQPMLKEIADQTFNCISVEGHMSTNDSLVLLANGHSDAPVVDDDQISIFQKGLYEVCEELSRMIPDDGEGAFHLVTLNIKGTKTRQDARTIAKVVAESALVKTAIHGADPNWGRIVSAAGYAGVPFDPYGVNLWVNGFKLFEDGAPLAFDNKTVSDSIRDNRETVVDLTFKEGDASIRFWTTDLSEEYVHLNADYTT